MENGDFIKLIIAAIIIALIVLLSSCSASWHIQKARQKDPTIFELFKKTKIDTVWVEVKRVDTLFKFDIDTVRIIKDSVKIKYFYSYKDSLVYIDVDCPDCPSIITTVTEKEMVYVKPTFWEKFKYALASLALSVLLFIALRTFRVL